MEGSTLSENKDLYQILAITRNASNEEIIEAYRARLDQIKQLAEEKDGSKNDPQQIQPNLSTAIFDIQSAYNVLTNPTQRAEYDKRYSPLVEEGVKKEEENKGDSEAKTKKTISGRQNITEVFKVTADLISEFQNSSRRFGSRNFDDAKPEESLLNNIAKSLFNKDLQELNKNQWHPTVFIAGLVVSLLAGVGFIMTIRFLME